MEEKEVLLDSDTLSFYMKAHETVVKNFDSYVAENGYVYLSRISVVEILGGLIHKDAQRQIREFKQLIASHKILDTDEVSAELSAEIYAELRKKGKHSGNYDILIAGIAKAHHLKLVTNNTKDYENIDGLELVNWTIKVS